MDAWRIISALWIVWLIFWIVSAAGTKRTVRRASSWRVGVVLVALALYAALTGFHGYLRHRLLPNAPWLAPTSVVLCAIGLAFSIWARVNLGRNWSVNPTIKEGHELIQTGPYRFVRHPIYTGLLLAIFATCLCGAKIMDLVIFVTVTAATIVKLRIEENLMLQQFPEAYPEYKKRTKALIPFVL